MSESTTFCINLFSQVATDNQGYYRPCCHFKGKLSDEDSGVFHAHTHTVNDFFHSKKLKDYRKDSLSNNKITGCSQCYMQEGNGVRSMRQRLNYEYNHLVPEKTMTDDDLQIKIMDLRLGNKCNLGCVMCSSDTSSFLSTEWKSHNLDMISHRYKPLAEFEDNLPIRDWWKNDDFINNTLDKAQSIEKLMLLGGEPLINKKNIKLLESLKHRGKNLEVEISTNATVINEEIMSLLGNFNTDLKCSIDGVHDTSNYIRYPIGFDRVEKNYDIILKSKIRSSVVCTVSIFNILKLKEIYLWFKGKSIEHKKSCYLNVGNIVFHPKYLAVENLPGEIKKRAIDDLNFIVDDIESCDQNYMNSDTFKNLANFLTLKPGNFDLIKDNMYMIEALDKIRSNSWKDIVPWLEDYL